MNTATKMNLPFLLGDITADGKTVNNDLAFSVYPFVDDNVIDPEQVIAGMLENETARSRLEYFCADLDGLKKRLNSTPWREFPFDHDEFEVSEDLNRLITKSQELATKRGSFYSHEFILYAATCLNDLTLIEQLKFSGITQISLDNQIRLVNDTRILEVKNGKLPSQLATHIVGLLGTHGCYTEVSDTPFRVKNEAAERHIKISLPDHNTSTYVPVGSMEIVEMNGETSFAPPVFYITGHNPEVDSRTWDIVESLDKNIPSMGVTSVLPASDILSNTRSQLKSPVFSLYEKIREHVEGE